MKKIALFVLSALMLLSSVSCGGDKTDGGAPSTSAIGEGTQLTETVTSETVTTEAVTAEAVTVGADTEEVTSEEAKTEQPASGEADTTADTGETQTKAPETSQTSTNAPETSQTATKAPETSETVTTETVTTKKEENTVDNTKGKNVYRVTRVAKKADIEWSSVPKASIDKYSWVKCKEYEAYAQLVFAEDFGFVCRMTCVESDPAATYTKFNDPVCLDSCMEFFVIFEGSKYLNLEANSIGTKCMGFGPNRNTRHNVGNRLKGGFAAIPEVGEDVWTLTYELPIDEIRIFYPNVTAETFAPGYQFSGNFYKTGGKEITGNEHYGMWNEVKTENPDFHQPKHFGIFIME